MKVDTPADTDTDRLGWWSWPEDDPLLMNFEYVFIIR